MVPNWLDEIEAQVIAATGRGRGMSARELAARLGLSEESAVSYIGLLASSGRLIIERVSLPSEARRREGARDLGTLVKAA